DPMWAPSDASMAQTAANYLGQVDHGNPVIFVVDRQEEETDFGMIVAFRRLRATMPAAMVPRVVVYLGDPENLLAGRPTYRPGHARGRQPPGVERVAGVAVPGVRRRLVGEPGPPRLGRTGRAGAGAGDGGGDRVGRSGRRGGPADARRVACRVRGRGGRRRLDT